MITTREELGRLRLQRFPLTLASVKLARHGEVIMGRRGNVFYCNRWTGVLHRYHRAGSWAATFLELLRKLGAISPELHEQERQQLRRVEELCELRQLESDLGRAQLATPKALARQIEKLTEELDR